MEVSDEMVLADGALCSFGENLQHWLTDETARDQFFIHSSTDLEVYWNSTGQMEPELVDHRPFFTQKFVKWSPQGTYLATVHPPCASVWGGPTFFNPLMCYDHRKVELIDFSPGEKYLVTQCRDMLKIFDLRTGELKINFWGSGHEFATGDTGGISGVSWPVVRWSGINDDIYFSRIEKNVISIYETKTFAPIDGEPLRVENVLDFSWSPVDPILALFVSAHDSASQSSGVTLIKIPSKEELKHKNLFNLSDCKIYWHSEGDYLAVIFKPFPETNMSKYTAFAFFKIKKPGIPIEDFELENKNDNIIAFAWEPKGDRFAIIHGMSQKPDISFYSMRSAQDKAGVSRLITLKGMQANTLFWSPVGRFIVLAGFGGFSGQLNFYDVDALETLATDQFEAKNIEWSPSGRYLATLGSLSTEMGKGVKIWSFCGKLLYQIPRIGVSQFSWRPRPPSFLNMQTEEEIVVDLKKKNKAEDVFILWDEQCRDPKKIPQGWDRWWLEWMRLGKLMLKNGKPSSVRGPVKELEDVEENLGRQML